MINIIRDGGEIDYDESTELLLSGTPTTGITQSVQLESNVIPGQIGTRAELDRLGLSGTWRQTQAPIAGSPAVEGFRDVPYTRIPSNMPPVGYIQAITAIDYVVNIHTLKGNTNLQEFQKMELAHQRNLQKMQEGGFSTEELQKIAASEKAL